MNPKFPKILIAAAAMVVSGLGTSLQASGITLLPGGSVSPPNLGGLPSGTIVASAFQSFSAGTLTGNLGLKVLSGGTDNPYAGGLTFVYEIKNTSPLSSTEGIVTFDVFGWAGYSTSVAYDSSAFYFSPSNNLVEPGTTGRSGGTGDVITFFFPPGPHFPPIFAGENSWQLIVFSNATTFPAETVKMGINDFDEDGEPISASSTTFVITPVLVPTTVPDGGTTAMLLGLGLVMLSLFAPRWKLAKA